MRKILYISGSRADYGLMRETLSRIKKYPGLKLDIIATGMHLMPEFGMTVKEIEKDGFNPIRINAIYEEDRKESMIRFVSKFLELFIDNLKSIKPDIILILGDRIEMLGAAITGAYLTIPVVHLHGGEVTLTVDEAARHAISKLSHFHLVATENSAKRLIKMGEEFWRIKIVGAPGLDDILNETLLSEKEIAKKYDLYPLKPIVLVLQHPVTSEIEESGSQMIETMEAIKKLEHQSVVIYPNADAGSREMIKIIENYRKFPFIKIYKNITRREFLSLMRVARVLVGNSSSGAIEASSFCLPVINIGTRQKGRERGDNIIDVGYHKAQIKKAIEFAICSKKFRNALRKCKNPYGDGKTGIRVAKILSLLKIDKKLLQKQITY